MNKEVKKADITELMKKLQELVGESIQIVSDPDREDIFIDLSDLNFEKLRELFEKQPMNKVVYDLQKAVAQKLNRMMQENPHRSDFYKKYLKIIQEYNEGKDEEAIKKAFEKLMKFFDELNHEEQRSMRENLDKETLAIYDLLRKENLTKKEEELVKRIAKETLEKLKQELGLVNEVSFIYKSTEQEKVSLLEKSDIFVMPSVVYKKSVEGFGITFIEAASYGKPSIAGIFGGEADAVLEGKTGFLCDGNDLNALYETLLKILNNEHYKKLGANALEFSKNFNWDKIVKKYIELI